MSYKSILIQPFVYHFGIVLPRQHFQHPPTDFRTIPILERDCVALISKLSQWMPNGLRFLSNGKIPVHDITIVFNPYLE